VTKIRVHGAFVGAVLGVLINLGVQYFQSYLRWKEMGGGPNAWHAFFHDLSYLMAFVSGLFFCLMGFFAQRRIDEKAEAKEIEAYLKDKGSAQAFSPHSQIIQTCLEGLRLFDEGRVEEARARFKRAWDASQYDYEKLHAAHFLARCEASPAGQLRWLRTALHIADRSDDVALKGARASLYAAIARSQEGAGDLEEARESRSLSERLRSAPADKGPFYHGTRAHLPVGDFLKAGGSSNYQAQLKMNHIYFSALLDGAGLAAELARGEQAARVYVVEPTGPYEDDPNVTDKKFLGNPTRSYRSEAPLKIVAEVTEWTRLSPEQLASWRAKLAGNKGAIIN
jgi:rifampin ADP-ribosylating transferase